jgi:hypothetical protein
MSAEAAVTSQAEIERGTVYTVAWSDATDERTRHLHTPKSGRSSHPDGKHGSWLMIGGRLRLFCGHLARHGVAPEQALEFAPWTDLSDIADRFASVFGFPGRMGFDPTGMTGLPLGGREFGGQVRIVEADVQAGADVLVRPLPIGDGWIAIHARVAPVGRVFAITARDVAVVTANMLGSACRRTRPEALAFLASAAAGAHPSLCALLSMRKASTGKTDIEARITRLGDLLGLDAALPCPNLFSFAEHTGKAAIAIAPEIEASEPRSCGTRTGEWP